MTVRFTASNFSTWGSSVEQLLSVVKCKWTSLNLEKQSFKDLQ